MAMDLTENVFSLLISRQPRNWQHLIEIAEEERRLSHIQAMFHLNTLDEISAPEAGQPDEEKESEIEETKIELKKCLKINNAYFNVIIGTYAAEHEGRSDKNISFNDIICAWDYGLCIVSLQTYLISIYNLQQQKAAGAAHSQMAYSENPFHEVMEKWFEDHRKALRHVPKADAAAKVLREKLNQFRPFDEKIYDVLPLFLELPDVPNAGAIADILKFLTLRQGD